MNTDQLARTTFVLDRVTSERLTAISRRMGVSRSALVRDVLAEPVELMHRWVESLPDDPAQADVDSLLGRMDADLGAFLDSKEAQLDLLKRGDGGNA